VDRTGKVAGTFFCNGSCQQSAVSGQEKGAGWQKGFRRGEMKKKKTYLLLAACVLIAGCATGPTGPPDVLRRPQTPGGRGVWGEIKVMPTRPGAKQRVLVTYSGKAENTLKTFKSSYLT